MDAMRRRYAILLFLTLACACAIRMPILNFPSIGYQNMKENEYISMAKNMIANKDFISREVYFYNAFTGKKDFGLFPQIPFVAYQIILGYKLFGENLWFGRLINIMFMLLSIITIFYLSGIFFKESAYGLIAALLLSIIPLGVYTSRNLQPESGAFFFMSLGNLLAIKFMQEFKRRYLFGLALCIFLAAGYKLTFLFGFIPLFIIFPYRAYILAKNPRQLAAEILLLILPIASFAAYIIIVKQVSFFASWENRVNPLTIFTASYWDTYGATIWNYVKNLNFTFIYFLLFTGGIIKSWLSYKKDASLLNRYLRAWSLIVIPYFMIFSDYLRQHNYYQMPFLGFACLAVVYCISAISAYIANTIHQKVKTAAIALIIFAISVLFSIPALAKGIMMPFAYQFTYVGTDEVGKILKRLTTAEDRIFIYTFPQGYSPCVYAERKCGWCDSLDEFKMNERKFGIKYIIIFTLSYMQNMGNDIKKYISQNYHLWLTGFVPSGGKLNPEIIVLKKGGHLDIGEVFSGDRSIKLQRVYVTPAGRLPFYIMTNEE